MFTWWNLVSFGIGTLFGSGVIWKLLDYRQRGREVAIAEAKAIAGLYQDLEGKLIKLMAMKDEYADVRDGKIPMDIPKNRLLQLDAHIDLLSRDIISCEQRLAKLGNRPTKEFIDSMRPAPPKVEVERTEAGYILKILPEDEP